MRERIKKRKDITRKLMKWKRAAKEDIGRKVKESRGGEYIVRKHRDDRNGKMNVRAPGQVLTCPICQLTIKVG